MQPSNLSPTRRALAMLSLILAGEAIFVPIYHLNRYFKSSFIDAFGIDESQIGDLFVWYGSVAMACYFLGGPIADRFSPKKLIIGSLVFTAIGSMYMATLPSFAALKWLYVFWGASSILTFWAPLMRATREWGGELAQGRAFGLLDGGRGLASAVIASVAAALFAGFVGQGESAADEAAAVKTLMWFYAGCCAVAAVAVGLFLPSTTSAVAGGRTTDASFSARLRAVANGVTAVTRMPAVWLQAIIVLAAYTAFRGFDNYGRYVEVAYGYDETQSANLMAVLSYLRAVAALGAGWVADRWLGVANTIVFAFGVLIACFVVLWSLPAVDWLYLACVANMAVSAVAFFGLRGIYFALFEETRVSGHLTGTAIGVISFIGYTPDIFFPKLYGWLVTSARDASDELAGYNRLWLLLTAFSIAGLVASRVLHTTSKQE